MIIALLALQGVVFLLWTVTAFRILFHLWRRSTVRTGTPFAGPVTFVRTVGDWLGDPAERGWRWALLTLTVAVMGLSFATYAAG
jgi:hypothetical protein